MGNTQQLSCHRCESEIKALCTRPVPRLQSWSRLSLSVGDYRSSPDVWIRLQLTG